MGSIEEKLTFSQKDINRALKSLPTVGLPSTAGYIREFLKSEVPFDFIPQKGGEHTRSLRVTGFYTAQLPDEIKNVF